MMSTQGYKPPSILSLHEAYAIFRLDRQSMRVRPSTLRYYEWTLTPFLLYLKTQDVINVDQVTGRHIRAYLVEKQVVDKGRPTEREASASYLHDIARAIRAFIRFCQNEEWIADNPMKNIKMPRKPQKILEAYTDKEIRKLLSAADSDREKGLILFLYDTGVRISEACGVTAGDIVLEESRVHIREGKGGKDRYVYFNAKTARILIRLLRGLEPTDYIWANRHTGKRMMYRGLEKTLRLVGERAEIHCTAHKFRRTFAITCLRNGMDIFTLSRLMGHTDISILKPYLNLLEGDLRNSHIQHGPMVDNL